MKTTIPPTLTQMTYNLSNTHLMTLSEPLHSLLRVQVLFVLSNPRYPPAFSLDERCVVQAYN